MGQSPAGETYNSMGTGTPLINGPAEFGRLHPTAVQWTTAPTRICKPNDILFCVRGNTTGRMNIADKEYCVGRGVASLRGITGRLDTAFLQYLLISKNYELYNIAKAGGSTFPNIGQSQLADLAVDIPESLHEQRAIANILEAVGKANEARMRELALEQERKAALMEHLFTHGTRGEKTKITEIGEIPEGWKLTRLGDCCDFLQYGTSQRCDAIEEGVPVLGIRNVVNGRVSSGGLKFLRATNEERRKLELHLDDLIFVRTNANRKFTGRCAVFRNEVPNALFASYLIRARLKPDSLAPDFVREYTDTWKGKSYLSGRASHAADGKFNINTQTIRAVLVPKPPLEEQGEIAAALRACDVKIDSLERETTLLDEVFKAMLDELMTGHLSAVPLIEGRQPQ
jgi:type I restriction enzyme, S subunit